MLHGNLRKALPQIPVIAHDGEMIEFGWDDMIGVQSMPAVMVVRLLFGEYLDVGQPQTGRDIASIVGLAVEIRFHDTGERVFSISPISTKPEDTIARVEG